MDTPASPWLSNCVTLFDALGRWLEMDPSHPPSVVGRFMPPCDWGLQVFERFSTSQNLELQQRACEYLGLPQTGIDVMEEVSRGRECGAQDAKRAS